MELVRKRIYITPAQDRAIKRLAQQQETTEAAILHKALNQFLAKEGIVEAQAMPSRKLCNDKLW